MKFEKILLILLYLSLGLLILYLANTKDDVDARIEESAEALKAVEQIAMQDIKVVTGQEVYVPAYSDIKSFDGKGAFKLSINLSVRNTDPDHSIIVEYLDFYNSAGHKSKAFLQKPLMLNPMATKDFHITQSDTIGGSGANFYLKWVADTSVNEPVIEAIMIGSSGTLGFSWKSNGLTVKTVDSRE